MCLFISRYYIAFCIYYVIYAALLLCEIMLKLYREREPHGWSKCSHHHDDTGSPYSFSYFSVFYICFSFIFILLSDLFVLVVIWSAHHQKRKATRLIVVGIRTTSWFFMRFERWTNPDTIWNAGGKKHKTFITTNEKKQRKYAWRIAVKVTIFIQ